MRNSLKLNELKNIAIFSLEMPAEQLIMRMISSLGQVDNKKLSSKEIFSSKYSLSSKSLENSSIKEEEEIEDNDNIDEKINYKERQLSILLDVFLTSYSKKHYK